MPSILSCLFVLVLVAAAMADDTHCGCLFLGYQTKDCSGTASDAYDIGYGKVGACRPWSWSRDIIGNIGNYYAISTCPGESNITLQFYFTEDCSSIATPWTDNIGQCKPITLTGYGVQSYQWQCGASGLTVSWALLSAAFALLWAFF